MSKYSFSFLQQNSLISYIPSKENAILSSINLSQKEKDFFEFLKTIIKENNLKNIELYAVGGWVRDHLLNLPSTDLDLVIKGISSKSFVKLLNEKFNKTKYIMVNNKIKKEGRELNLTKTKIFDINIDFVEIYNDIITDAKRRDFTFNAIYYNILENKIEDILNKGINDLKNGYIRICSTPNQLFNYDSLNIIRMIRFATKYNFIIDDACLEEIEKNKNIYKNNLLNKISKERIHKEINIIFNGPNPSFAIYSFYNFGILEDVLHIDRSKKNIDSISEKDMLDCVNIFIIGKICYDRYKKYFQEENFDDNYTCLYYSLLLTIVMNNFFDDHQNNLAKVILAKVLKIEGKINLKIINHFDEFNNLISKNEYDRLKVGVLLRKLLISNVSKIILISVSNEYVKKINSKDILNKIDENELDNIFNKYFEFVKYYKKENMENINEMKPAMEGKEIKENFPGIDNKYLKTIMDNLINKQIEKNKNLSKEEAINYIKLMIQELNIEIDEANEK